MQPHYIRIRELTSAPARGTKPARKGRYPFSEATAWRLSNAGKFPPPVRLSGGITAWVVEELDQWDAEREAERDVVGRAAKAILPKRTTVTAQPPNEAQLKRKPGRPRKALTSAEVAA